MNSKKFLYSLGSFTLVIGVIVMGIMIRQSNFFPKRKTVNNYCIDNLNQNLDKDSLYYDYNIEALAGRIKDENGITDCKINVNYLNGEIISVNISVVVEDDEVNISETDILDYVSQSLEISIENIELSYD